MKKISVFIAALVLTSATAFAQMATPEKEPMKVEKKNKKTAHHHKPAHKKAKKEEAK